MNTVETPQVQFLNEFDRTVVVQRQLPMVQTVEVQQWKFIDTVIEIHVLTRRQIPMMQTIQEIQQVEQAPQAQMVKKSNGAEVSAIPYTQFINRAANFR